MVTFIVYISLSVLAQFHILSYLCNKEPENFTFLRGEHVMLPPPPLDVASGQLHELYPRTKDDSTSLLHIARKAAAGFHSRRKGAAEFHSRNFIISICLFRSPRYSGTDSHVVVRCADFRNFPVHFLRAPPYFSTCNKRAIGIIPDEPAL
jgi:hypothetical protein